MHLTEFQRIWELEEKFGNAKGEMIICKRVYFSIEFWFRSLDIFRGKTINLKLNQFLKPAFSVTLTRLKLNGKIRLKPPRKRFFKEIFSSRVRLSWWWATWSASRRRCCRRQARQVGGRPALAPSCRWTPKRASPWPCRPDRPTSRTAYRRNTPRKARFRFHLHDSNSSSSSSPSHVS